MHFTVGEQLGDALRLFRVTDRAVLQRPFQYLGKQKPYGIHVEAHAGGGQFPFSQKIQKVVLNLAYFQLVWRSMVALRIMRTSKGKGRAIIVIPLVKYRVFHTNKLFF